MDLSGLLVGGVFVWILVFARIGTAVMMMPGAGETFIPAQVRLLFALAFATVIAPFAMPAGFHPPAAPVGVAVLVCKEAFVGLFIGMAARIVLSALDTAGTVIGQQAGLSNAFIFNPYMASQGSATGLLMMLGGVVILMASGLHHVVIRAIVDSYAAFPPGEVLPTGDMADVATKLVSTAFLTGFKLSAPLVVVGLLVSVGMGFVARLMPQLPIFFVGVPVQVALGLLVLAITIPLMLVMWLNGFEPTLTTALGGR